MISNDYVFDKTKSIMIKVMYVFKNLRKNKKACYMELEFKF